MYGSDDLQSVLWEREEERGYLRPMQPHSSCKVYARRGADLRPSITTPVVCAVCGEGQLQHVPPRPRWCKPVRTHIHGGAL